MINNCRHCKQTTPPPTPRQRTLAVINGLVALGPPPSSPPRPIRRTPAGKAVRNIANTPTFITTDPSLTTFLRFPPEVRLQIYGYLLISYQTIHLDICPLTFCLVERTWQFRLRIFPTILECCRQINEEGSAVLYGQNMFEVERYEKHYGTITIATWSPVRENLLCITRLTLTFDPDCECLQDRKTLELMNLFPALKEVNIRLEDISVEEWVAFLVEACGELQRMKKFMLEIHAYHKAGQIICKQWPPFLLTDEEMCLRIYREPFLQQQAVWKNRGVRWDFEQEPDSLSRCYGILGSLRVFVE